MSNFISQVNIADYPFLSPLHKIFKELNLNRSYTYVKGTWLGKNWRDEEEIRTVMFRLDNPGLELEPACRKYLDKDVPFNITKSYSVEGNTLLELDHSTGVIESHDFTPKELEF